MPHIRLESVEDPQLRWYRDLNRSNLTRLSGRFIVEGRWLVERLANSEYPVESVVVDERHVDEVPVNLRPDLPVFVIRANQISRLVGFGFHRGMLACGRRKPGPTICDVMQRSPSERVTLVVCPQVVDPTNLGGIIRNCAAFGIDSLILGAGCADPFSRRVVRVSMGTVFRVPIIESADLSGFLRQLKSMFQCRLVATVVQGGATVLPQAQRSPRMAILFGSEGAGLDQHWIDRCDECVTLPMRLGTDSLNLATAVGIFLYHFVDQLSADQPPGHGG
jgi:tRNA G18 (ribose-2'-O)-methylase SpoU